LDFTFQMGMSFIVDICSWPEVFTLSEVYCVFKNIFKPKLRKKFCGYKILKKIIKNIAGIAQKLLKRSYGGFVFDDETLVYKRLL